MTEPTSETLDTIANVFGVFFPNQPFGAGRFSARNKICTLIVNLFIGAYCCWCCWCCGFWLLVLFFLSRRHKWRLMGRDEQTGKTNQPHNKKWSNLGFVCILSMTISVPSLVNRQMTSPSRISKGIVNWSQKWKIAETVTLLFCGNMHSHSGFSRGTMDS